MNRRGPPVTHSSHVRRTLSVSRRSHKSKHKTETENTKHKTQNILFLSLHACLRLLEENDHNNGESSPWSAWSIRIRMKIVMILPVVTKNLPMKKRMWNNLLPRNSKKTSNGKKIQVLTRDKRGDFGRPEWYWRNCSWSVAHRVASGLPYKESFRHGVSQWWFECPWWQNSQVTETSEDLAGHPKSTPRGTFRTRNCDHSFGETSGKRTYK